MFSVHHLTRDRTSYYLSDLARELPLGAAGPTGHHGAWVGQTAAALGLEGMVDPERFRTVLAGRLPATGHPVRSEQATVWGYDLTFSTPKSASVLFALGGHEVTRAVMAAHGAAVQSSVGYLEARALTVSRRIGSERAVLATDGMVAAAFTHGVTRNVDPHLHTHVVMANLVRSDDRWSACDQRGLSAHRSATAALYEAHLRRELSSRLGVQWTQGPQTQAEIVGVPPLLLGEFSSRAADIRRHAHDHGAHTAAGRRIAWAATRSPKVSQASFSELTTEWQHRADAALGHRLDLAPLYGQRAAEPDTLSEHQYGAVLARAADGSLRRRDVVEAFAASARLGAAGPTIASLTDLWVRETGAVGVAEPALLPRSVQPTAVALRTLGPRPLDPEAHCIWVEAAHSLERYRSTWRVSGPEPLGAPHAAEPTWPTARLVEHLDVSRALDAARTRLGLRPPARVELDRGR